MSTAKQIKYWNSESMEYTTSAREYIECDEGLRYTEVVGDYYRYNEGRTAIVYLDVENGLVVHDIEKYERWLNA
jgi:hypothetical protein